MYSRVVGSLPTCPKIAITGNAAATVKNGYLRPPDILVAGDVAQIIRRISERPGGIGGGHSDLRQPNGRTRWWSSRTDSEPRGRACGASAVDLVRAISRGLASVSNPVIVDDSQMFGGLVAANYDLLPASVRVFGSHGGFVGGGLATAVGLAIAHPSLAVMALVGDQGFTNGLQALAAASEHRAPLVILVCNNGASVSLRRQADFDGLRTLNTSVLTNVEYMSYAAVSEGFGLTAVVETWPGDTPGSDVAADRLTSEICRALATRRPCLIEVVVPSRPAFWSGIWRTCGFEERPPSP